MSKTDRRLLIAVVLALALLASAKILSTPQQRAGIYFATYRSVYRNSPEWIRRHLGILGLLGRFSEPFAPVWTDLKDGIRMKLDPYDLLSRQILLSGEWEKEEWSAMKQHLIPGSTFVDVGAHIGYYSLQASTIVGPSGHVITVEPNPEILPILRDNIQASHASSITLWPVACAETDSILSLYAAPKTNSGETSLAEANASQEGTATARYAVQAKPLDAIIFGSHMERVDLIKIDVEGAELGVLKGATQTLKRFRPVLLIEMIPYQLKAMGTSTEEVIQYLDSLGYLKNRDIDAINVEFTPKR